MKIVVGNSRMDKKWKNQDIPWADLCARCGSTIRTTETVEEYRKLKKGQQDGIKDVGGFVGGHLREGRRKNGMVLCRSLLTLDMDYEACDAFAFKLRIALCAKSIAYFLFIINVIVSHSQGKLMILKVKNPALKGKINQYA